MNEQETTWRCLHENPLPEVEPTMSNFDHGVSAGLAGGIAVMMPHGWWHMLERALKDR
jgi:hypothetical protein